MSAAKNLKHSPRLLCEQLALLCLVLAILSGCSTTPSQDADMVEDSGPVTSSSDSSKASQAQPTQDVHENSSDHESDSQPLCVYETIKGVAEVTEITESIVTFKFYPGDKHFKIPLKKVPSANIKLEQELKAIARSPISGPCKNDEFELLTTIE